MTYLNLDTLTIRKIEAANGNEVSVKRPDGAVFTVRHIDAQRYFVRDTRKDDSILSGYSPNLADIHDRITSRIED